MANPNITMLVGGSEAACAELTAFGLAIESVLNRLGSLPEGFRNEVFRRYNVAQGPNQSVARLVGRRREGEPALAQGADQVVDAVFEVRDEVLELAAAVRAFDRDLSDFIGRHAGLLGVGPAALPGPEPAASCAGVQP